MSTQKWPDDDLDDLFRKSAEASDPAYDPAAWRDLQTRLNERDHTLLTAKLLRWVLPLLLLLVSTGGIIWYTRQPDSRKSTRAIQEPANVNTTESGVSPPDRRLTIKSLTPPKIGQPRTTNSAGAAISQPTAISRTALPNIVAAGSTTASSDGKPVAINPVISLRDPTGKSITTDRLSSRSGSRENQPSMAEGPDAGIQSARLTRSGSTVRRNTGQRTKRIALETHTIVAVADQLSNRPNGTARQDAKPGGLGRRRSVVSGLVTKPNPITDSQFTDTDPGSTNLVSSESVAGQEEQVTAIRFTWPVLEILPVRGLKWPAMPALTAEPVSLEPRDPLPRPHPSRRSGLSVQLVASPDLSTIGLRNFDRPGSNVGLLVQYQLSERFSLQAGGLWSTKRYTTPASEYVWPVAGSTAILPESITGKCTMLDLPLNLRYDVLLRPGGAGRGPARWFVSGGATSYFIDHEVYSFNYADPNNPNIRRRGWDNKVAGRKGGRFGLSNLNVSVGYEQPISQRLSWQIEPFMKMPLQQIGYFKVRLVSTGAFLSLRYRL